jgi:hypothetical protein
MEGKDQGRSEFVMGNSELEGSDGEATLEILEWEDMWGLNEMEADVVLTQIGLEKNIFRQSTNHPTPF